jgi:hypothetical protein
MTLQPRRPGRPPAARQARRGALAPQRDAMALTARGAALITGIGSFIAGVADAFANILQYASPSLLLFFGFWLIVLAAGRRIPNVFGR